MDLEFRKRTSEQKKRTPAPYEYPLVWGGFLYQCQDCKKEWVMWLEYGVGSGYLSLGRKTQPCPFAIKCHFCNGEAIHVKLHKDLNLCLNPDKKLRPLSEGCRYFRYNIDDIASLDPNPIEAIPSVVTFQ